MTPEERRRMLTVDPNLLHEFQKSWEQGEGGGVALYEYLGWTLDEWIAYISKGVVPNDGHLGN